MKIFIIFICIPGFLAFSLAAENDTAYKFLNISPSAQARGLADSYSARVQNAFALLYNPAGLAYVEGKQIYLSDVEWLADARLLSLSYAQDLFAGGLGVSVIYFGVPSFEKYGSSGTMEDSSLSKADYAVSAGYGRQILDSKLFAGADIKYLYSELADKRAAALMGDAGILYQLKTFSLGVNDNNLALALVMRNIGQNLSDYHKSEPLPLQGILGLSYWFLSIRGHSLHLVSELKKYFDNDLIPSAGLEYDFNNKFFIRSGYIFDNDLQSVTMGVGVKHHARDAYYINFDLAYAPAVFEEKIITISLGISYQPRQKSNEVYDRIIQEKKKEWNKEKQKE